MADQIYVWRVYHPDNWNPKKISGKNYTEPPIAEDHIYLIEAENGKGEFDGYLIGMIANETPTLTEYWSSRGWLLESKGEWKNIFSEADRQLPEPEETKTQEIIEVHNCWAVYGVERDGTEVEQPIAQFSRPQDWGDSRWHYERFRFEWTYNNKHYINHAHCWTDIKRELFEYPQLFAQLIVQILMPGAKEQFCGREYLAEDDFWLDEWGPMPPYYYSENEYFEDDED